MRVKGEGRNSNKESSSNNNKKKGREVYKNILKAAREFIKATLNKRKVVIVLIKRREKREKKIKK